MRLQTSFELLATDETCARGHRPPALWSPGSKTPGTMKIHSGYSLSRHYCELSLILKTMTCEEESAR